MREFLKRIVEYLFYLFLFLIPWQTRLILKEGALNQGYWEWGTYSLYAIDLIFVLLVILFCFDLLFHPSISNSKFLISKQIPNSKSQTQNSKSQILNYKFQILNSKLFKLLVICFLLFAFLSIFWAKNSGLAFYWLLRLLQGAILFFLIQKINFDFIKAGFVLIFAGLIQAFLSISQFINQKVFASKWLGMAAQDPAQFGVSIVETAESRLLRVYGSLPHPNILAGFLVFLIFISFILYLLLSQDEVISLRKVLGRSSGYGSADKAEGKTENQAVISSLEKSTASFRATDRASSWQRYFLLFSTSLITMTLFLTYSRAAWLSLIICIILFGLFLFKKSFVNFRIPFFEFFGLILIITLIFSIFSLRGLIVRLETKGRLEARSVNERILNFQRGLEIVKENFIFGVGVGNYTSTLAKKYPSLASWDIQPVANIYLLILAELGIIGFLLFLLIIGFTFYCLKFKIYSLYFISPLIIGLFDHWLFSLSFGIILFWLALGLLWKTFREKS